MDLPHGVRLSSLRMNRDPRGWVTEIFRDEWNLGVAPCQWNASLSEANVLRGVHVHHRHHDYLVLLRGRASVGLYDARPKSPTHRRSAMIELRGDDMSGIRVPVGVMHGFYFHEPSMHIYGVDSYFDPDDDLACHWADPGLGIAWPCRDPVLSERDRHAGTLAGLEARLRGRSVEFA
jgi:dTDP-4-dehydrorhamnose 3,5-epimerase